MSTRNVAGGLLIAAVVLVLAPIPVAAHALGGVFTLPVPLGLYLVAAGATVAVSFAVAVLVVASGRTGAVLPDPTAEPGSGEQVPGSSCR